VWLAEDVVKICQELIKERAASRGCAHGRCLGAWQPLPPESATLVYEGDRAVAEIPHDGPKHGEPPGAEDGEVLPLSHRLVGERDRRLEITMLLASIDEVPGIYIAVLLQDSN
jgi:hypothetical protein